MKKSKEVKDLTIGVDLSDKKRSDRHTAEWLLIANIRYVDELGVTQERYKIIVNRCFTRSEAYKFIRTMELTETEKQVGFKANADPKYKTVMAQAPKFSYMSDGKVLYEVLDDYEIINKKQYFGLA